MEQSNRLCFLYISSVLASSPLFTVASSSRFRSKHSHICIGYWQQVQTPSFIRLMLISKLSGSAPDSLTAATN